MAVTTNCPCCGLVWRFTGNTLPRPGDFPTTTNCAQCSGGAAEYWEVTIAGMTNGTNCVGCTRFNGTWVLRHTVVLPSPCSGSGCQWDTIEGGLECCTDVDTHDCNQRVGFTWGGQFGVDVGPIVPALSLEHKINDPNETTLRIQGFGNPPFCSTTLAYAIWKMDAADFNCNDDNTLTLDSSDTSLCATYPSSLTITPTFAP